jgi:hypothetical protein
MYDSIYVKIGIFLNNFEPHLTNLKWSNVSVIPKGWHKDRKYKHFKFDSTFGLP